MERKDGLVSLRHGENSRGRLGHPRKMNQELGEFRYPPGTAIQARRDACGQRGRAWGRSGLLARGGGQTGTGTPPRARKAPVLSLQIRSAHGDRARHWRKPPRSSVGHRPLTHVGSARLGLTLWAQTQISPRTGHFSPFFVLQFLVFTLPVGTWVGTGLLDTREAFHWGGLRHHLSPPPPPWGCPDRRPAHFHPTVSRPLAGVPRPAVPDSSLQAWGGGRGLGGTRSG